MLPTPWKGQVSSYPFISVCVLMWWMDLVTLFATIEDPAQLVVERREESLIVVAAFELISIPRASILAHSLRSKQVLLNVNTFVSRLS